MDNFRHMKVGVLMGARTETILKKSGFDNIDPVPSIKTNPKKLLRRRLDAWFDGELIIKFTLQEMGMNDGRIKIVFRRPKVTMYLAASPDIPDNVIDLWRSKMNDIKSDGTYRGILKKYGIDSKFVSD